MPFVTLSQHYDFAVIAPDTEPASPNAETPIVRNSKTKWNQEIVMTTGTSHGRDQQRNFFMKIVTMLGFSILALAGCATPTASSGDNDTIELQNKEVVSDFFERFSEGEIDAAFEMVSDDVRWWVPGIFPFQEPRRRLSIYKW